MYADILENMRNMNLGKLFCFLFVIEEKNFVCALKNFFGNILHDNALKYI